MVNTRGQVENGKIAYWQVSLKVGHPSTDRISNNRPGGTNEAFLQHHVSLHSYRSHRTDGKRCGTDPASHRPLER
ncbi:dodecin family protein [Rhizobium leguminosarum]|uniref:dodecin family protein n=1 Tax=Rhizobium leguminosarum TaxID=384 RepID=UPI001FCBB11B|nr:dodecin family protein [Rhizobium leguminosarum]